MVQAGPDHRDGNKSVLPGQRQAVASGGRHHRPRLVGVRVRLALIGDIHLFSLKIQPRRLVGRRILGHTNLWLNRQFRFNHALLEPLPQRVRRVEPELVLLSGDVATTSLEDEFHDIERFLRPMAGTVPTLIVPGNHDRYTFRSARRKRVEALLEGLVPPAFPHVLRLTDRWRLLALDAARPQIVWSRGALGPRQMDEVRYHLEELGRTDGLIVLCHYPAATPPHVPKSWAHALAEARLLRQMLTRCPARVGVHTRAHPPPMALVTQRPRRRALHLHQCRLTLSDQRRLSARPGLLANRSAGRPRPGAGSGPPRTYT